MLYVVGIGLGDEKDITVKGLEAVKSCDFVYLEGYTSKLCSFDLGRMEKLYGKKIEVVDRKFVEDSKEIIEKAKEKDVALLIVGSVLGATTHMQLINSAKENKIKVKVIDNSGVLTAVGITGLSLYKFGRVTTIPFDNENVKSPYDVVLDNKKLGLHTLVLLDIQDDKMMSAREGLDYFLRMGLDKEEKVIVCGGLGGDTEIKYGNIKDVSINKFPQCVIIIGNLHFSEEEFLKNYA